MHIFCSHFEASFKSESEIEEAIIMEENLKAFLHMHRYFLRVGIYQVRIFLLLNKSTENCT